MARTKSRARKRRKSEQGNIAPSYANVKSQAGTPRRRLPGWESQHGSIAPSHVDSQQGTMAPSHLKTEQGIIAAVNGQTWESTPDILESKARKKEKGRQKKKRRRQLKKELQMLEHEQLATSGKPPGETYSWKGKHITKVSSRDSDTPLLLIKKFTHCASPQTMLSVESYKTPRKKTN